MNSDHKSKRTLTRAPGGCPKEVAHGELELIPGNFIPCAVLDNEMRVLSTRGVSKAFGSLKTGTDRTKTGAPQPPPFLAAANLKPYLSDRLIALLNSPIVYQPKAGGRTAYGYDRSVFPEICKTIVAADRAGKLRETQQSAARLASTMLDALVGVAMDALIDEATGYRANVAHDEYQKILKAYVLPEMRPWLRRFPPEFTDLTFKIMGWKRNGKSTQTPRIMGKVINECIYRRLPEPVLPELQRMNPVVNGRRRHKHHQALTPDTGIPHLDRQIISVMTLMRAARDRLQFRDLLIRAFPVAGDQMLMDLWSDTEDK